MSTPDVNATKTILQYLNAGGLGLKITVGPGLAHAPSVQNYHRSITLDGKFEDADDPNTLEEAFRKVVALLKSKIGLAGIRTDARDPYGNNRVVTWVKETGKTGKGIQFVSVVADYADGSLTVEVGDLSTSTSYTRLLAQLCWPKLQAQGYFS